MLRGGTTTIKAAIVESARRLLEDDGEGGPDYDSSDGGTEAGTFPDAPPSESDPTMTILAGPSSDADYDGGALPTDTADSTFNVLRFCIIISVAFLVLTAVFIWCCKRGGASFVEHWTSDLSGSLSDRVRLNRILERRRAEEERKKECPERRKRRLVDNIEKNGVVLIVTDSDFVKPHSDATVPDEESAELETGRTSGNESNADDVSNDSTAEQPSGVNLPTSAPNGNRSVPNCCAVCLCPYDAGDSLAWSSNSACQHAFHEDCVVEWLVKMQDGTPCPCCRQEFTDLEPYDPDGDKKDLGISLHRDSEATEISSYDGYPAFSVTAISFR